MSTVQMVPGVAAADPAAYGAAVEHLAAAELLFRGLDVAWPAVDRGYDLLVDFRVRVQVKASSRRDLTIGGRYTYGRFLWSGVGSRKWDGGRQVPRVVDRSNVDVFVLFGLDAGGRRRWWIVPGFELRDVAGSLNFMPGSSRGIGPVVASYEDAWHVFDEGFDLAPQIQLGEVVLEVAR